LDLEEGARGRRLKLCGNFVESEKTMSIYVIDGNLDLALKHLKFLSVREGILKSIHRHEYFISSSERKRLKHRRAIGRELRRGRLQEID
jgi:ribosomal protein S21